MQVYANELYFMSAPKWGVVSCFDVQVTRRTNTQNSMLFMLFSLLEKKENSQRTTMFTGKALKQ